MRLKREEDRIKRLEDEEVSKVTVYDIHPDSTTRCGIPFEF